MLSYLPVHFILLPGDSFESPVFVNTAQQQIHEAFAAGACRAIFLLRRWIGQGRCLCQQAQQRDHFLACRRQKTILAYSPESLRQHMALEQAQELQVLQMEAFALAAVAVGIAIAQAAITFLL